MREQRSTKRALGSLASGRHGGDRWYTLELGRAPTTGWRGEGVARGTVGLGASAASTTFPERLMGTKHTVK